MSSKRVAQNITNTLVSKLKLKDKPYEVRDLEKKGLLLRVQPSGTMTYYYEYARGKRVKIGDIALSPEEARNLCAPTAAEHARSKVGLGQDPSEKRKKEKSARLGG